MIKNFRYMILVALIIMAAGCSKPDALSGSTTDTALLSITNANASSKTIDLYVDGVKANQFSAISTPGTVLGTYVGTTPGTHTFEVRDGVTNTVYASSSVTVEGAKTYSAFVYDVATAGTLKLLVLNTDRTLPTASTDANIRFLNLSPGSPALDVYLVRRIPVGGVPSEINSTKVFSNVAYVGSTTPVVSSLSAFTPYAANIPAGINGSTAQTDYIVRLTLAGTATVVANSASITLVNGKIYTIYARGVYPAVSVSTVLHN